MESNAKWLAGLRAFTYGTEDKRASICHKWDESIQRTIAPRNKVHPGLGNETRALATSRYLERRLYRVRPLERLYAIVVNALQLLTSAVFVTRFQPLQLI